MKVMLLVTRANQGGAQTNVLALAKHLKTTGHNVRIGTGETGWLVDEASKNEIPITIFRNLKRSANPFLSIGFILALRKDLISNPVDVLHFHSSNSLIGVIATAFLGQKKPVRIATVHGLSVLNPGWQGNILIKKAYSYFVRWFWSSCQKLIFVCCSDKDFAIKKGYATAKQSVVIYNGISDRVEFLSRIEARAELKISADKIVIGTVARLSYQKDISLMLSVAEKIKDNQIQFVVVGDGEDYNKLQSSIIKQNLEDSVIIYRKAKDGYKLMKAFDIFLLTSRYEGLPYTLLEAGLASLPTVAVAVDGVSEVIEQQKTGQLVNSRNANEIVNELKYILTDDGLLKQYSAEARKKVLADFSEIKMSEQTELIYRQTINENT